MWTRQAQPVESLAFINNPISARMLLGALRAEGVDQSKMVLIVLRPLKPESWWANCALTLVYPTKASLKIYGQCRFIPFYIQASRVLKMVLRSASLKHVFVVNNDNILTNHAIHLARKIGGCRISVISEGFMNYQDIRLVNRAAWRNHLRPLFARILGLQWHTPAGHLSGAFEEPVSTVYGFTKDGLFAPEDKVRVLPMTPVVASVQKDPESTLFLETALWQWMARAEFEAFAESFSRWLKQLHVKRLLVKPHPNYPPSQYLRKLLPEHEVAYESDSVESLADKIAATRVVGFCCTGLATLKLLRPDLQCIDFGHDYYLEHAYGGDKSLLRMMESVGVQLQPYDQH